MVRFFLIFWKNFNYSKMRGQKSKPGVEEHRTVFGVSHCSPNWQTEFFWQTQFVFWFLSVKTQLFNSIVRQLCSSVRTNELSVFSDGQQTDEQRTVFANNMFFDPWCKHSLPTKIQ